MINPHINRYCYIMDKAVFIFLKKGLKKELEEMILSLTEKTQKKSVDKLIMAIRLALKLFIKAIAFVLNNLKPGNVVKNIKNDIKRHKIIYTVAALFAAAQLIIPVAHAEIGMDFGGLRVMDFAGGPTSALISELSLSYTGVNQNVATAANQVYDLLMPIGIALCCMWWLGGVGELFASGRDVSVFEYVQKFISLIFTIIVITEAWSFMEQFNTLGETLMGDIVTSFGEGVAVADTPSHELQFDILTFMSMLLPHSIIFLIALISLLVVYIQCLARKLKYFTYLALAPIGFSNIAGGMHSPAMTYARKLLAIILQGPVIIVFNYVLLCTLSGYLTDYGYGTLEELVNWSWNLLAIVPILVTGLVGIGLYSQSSAIADALVGAR